MSLKQPVTKMSKSHEDPRSRILISDSAEEIKAKIKLALTDSISGISYDPSTRPGVSNLLSIVSYLDKEQRSCERLAASYENLTMRQFKDEVFAAVDRELSGIRERYDRLMQSDGGEALDAIARQGAVTANREARGIMTRVRKAIGLY